MDTSSEGLRGDIGRLCSDKGTHAGRPSGGRALQRTLTRVEELETQVADLQRQLGG